MKKRELFLLLGVLIALYQAISVYSQQGVGVGLVLIDTTAPVINLIEPINNSGDNDGNITFTYNVSDASQIHNCSLIINNKINTTNTSTIEKDTKLTFTVNNTAIGIYNWSINCTDNLGFNGSSAERTFSVSIMKNFNGSTTNLSLVTNISNVTGFVLEIAPYGKINYTTGADLSKGLNIDDFVNITSNKIELNSTELKVLNKSATISLYGLTFTDPRPLRDGDICPASICTEVPPYSKAEGTFVFNVTHFTVYSSEETPTPTTTTITIPGGVSGGGGGGGGGTRPVIAQRSFTISKQTLKVVLKQGQTKMESFTITNTGDLALTIKIDLKELKDFIISPISDVIDVALQPDEEETIFLNFIAYENLTPDVYPREIYVKDVSGEKIIYAIIEVESTRPLFDVDVEVLPEYKTVFPGDGIFMDVSLFNIRGFGRVDVNLEYSIRDFKGNIIATEHETVAVETQAKFTRELLLPRDTIPGTYVASVKVTFEDSVGLSSDIFEVKAKSIKLYPIIRDNTLFLLLGAIFIVVSVFLVYQFYLPRGKPMPKTKEERGKLIRKEERIEKLGKELKALESAYKSKFISQASYNKDQERIEEELKKLRG